MSIDESAKYEEWLKVVAGTRLLFNTLAELEEFLGVRAIATNGISRCFPTDRKLRTAFRDCFGEVRDKADGLFSLSWLMRNYKLAWDFYKSRLSRRKDPEAIAQYLLSRYYKADRDLRPTAALDRIYSEMEAEKVDPALLLLFLLKALPGYDSRQGDVKDIDTPYDRVMDFLTRFTTGTLQYEEMPVIRAAKDDPVRTRFSLIYHTVDILETYNRYSSPDDINETSARVQNCNAGLDVEGFWVEKDTDSFWEMSAPDDFGYYFAIRYTRESPGILSFTRYTMLLLHPERNRLSVMLTHPKFIIHLINKTRTDEDQAWYSGPYPQDDAPESLQLTLAVRSEPWPSALDLRRLTDPKDTERMRLKIETSTLINNFENIHYEFSTTLYAVTQESVYVADPEKECFYKLPRYTEHKFELINIGDNVGIVEIGAPGSDRRRYIAIDNILLYIPITPKSLRRYGIEKVTEIHCPPPPQKGKIH